VLAPAGGAGEVVVPVGGACEGSSACGRGVVPFVSVVKSFRRVVPERLALRW
jgi:hypothetical protein